MSKGVLSTKLVVSAIAGLFATYLIVANYGWLPLIILMLWQFSNNLVNSVEDKA